MTPEIESLFRDVDQAKPDMRATWAYLVNHDSGSKNKAAVDALQAFAAHTLKKCGFSVRFHEYEEAGNLLVAERGGYDKTLYLSRRASRYGVPGRRSGGAALYDPGWNCDGSGVP